MSVNDREQSQLLPLDSPVQHYAWGSATVIPELLNRPATGEPVAELWLGAHPGAPSVVDDGSLRTLTEVLDARPELLGEAVRRQFGELPFLLKVLAVERPLSLQAHPSKRQAEAGFAAENADGVAIDSPDRNYKDANHKAEMICALTPFVGLCGFRPTERTAEFLAAIGSDVLKEFAGRIVADGGLRDVVTDLLTRPADGIARLLAEVVPAARRLADVGGEWAEEAAWVGRLDASYPGDRGVAIATLMNLVHLAPGQAMFLPAGQLHAYLGGVGVELLANSDNVLRGGLTGKHIDVPALLGVLQITAGVVVPIQPSQPVAGMWSYPSPVADFALDRVDLNKGAPVSLDPGAPRILLCTNGTAMVRSGSAIIELPRGSGLFVGAEATVQLSAIDGETDGAIHGATVFAARPNLTRRSITPKN